MAELQFDPGQPLRWELPAGEEPHRLQRKQGKAKVLEMEDLQFHRNSAVWLPDHGECHEAADGGAAGDRVTGLVVLEKVFAQAAADPSRSLLVVGHTDTTGEDEPNLYLSDLRARNVYAFLRGDRSGWVATCVERSKVEDVQQILHWAAAERGWDCLPGPVDDRLGPKTRAGIEGFQREFNADFEASVAVDGVVGPETWGAMFDVLSAALAARRGTDLAGLERERRSLAFHRPAAIGCGEVYPIEGSRKNDYRSQKNRRVELLFFEEGEAPAPVGGQGDCGLCALLYVKGSYDFEPIPCDPAPSPTLLRAYLQLRLQGPDGGWRPFPEGLAVRVLYANGTEQVRLVGEEGRLDFAVRRNGEAFTLRLDGEEACYYACDADGQEARAVGEGDLGALEEGWKWFRFPPGLGLDGGAWEVAGAGTWNPGSARFEGLEDASTVLGTQDAPVTVDLKLRWQFVQFTYFDRQAKKQDAVPVFLRLEGFRDAAQVGEDAPDACACWEEQGAQALPWFEEPGAEEPLLRFRTDPGTYLKTADDGSRTVEVGLDLADPGPERLRYYDLPELWCSTGWWTRLSGGAPDAEPSEQGVFADMAAVETSPKRPLVFCLDDMVLTDERLRPEEWKADGTPENRLALFCNTFCDDGGSPDDAELGPYGVFRPDAANHQEYFSADPSDVTDRNYVATYPRWTRLIVRNGNLYDVFAARTPEGCDVVGARAAVRSVDAPAELSVGTRVGDRPLGRVDRPFFSVQPVHHQRFDASRSYSRPQGHALPNGVCREWERPFPLLPSGWQTVRTCGRSDVALLRCCGVDEEGNERAIYLQYLRLSFDFHPTPSGLTAGWTPCSLTEEEQRAFANDACKNPPERWNGRDTAHGHPAVFEPQDEGIRLRVRPLLFFQHLPRARAHYEVGVYEPGRGRAFMSSDGTGALTLYGNPGAWATAAGRSDVESSPGDGYVLAHELGHATSHYDEYNERWMLRSAHMLGFACWIPGDPYDVDQAALMNGNRDLRARYFWQGAEWCRLALGGIPLRVRQRQLVQAAGQPDECTFELPAHPDGDPRRTYVNWPLYSRTPLHSGARGRCHVFVYPLGAADCAYTLGPDEGTSTPFDGLFVVLVRMRWRVARGGDELSFAKLREPLQQAEASIERTFNNKFYASGFTLGPRSFERCLLVFSPRFLVESFPHDNDRYLSDCGVRGLPDSEPARGNFFADVLSADENVAGSWLSLCEQVESRHPRDFFVNADEGIEAGGSGWREGDERTLDLSLKDDVEASFYQWFGDMLGLDLCAPEPWWKGLLPGRRGAVICGKLKSALLEPVAGGGEIEAL